MVMEPLSCVVMMDVVGHVGHVHSVNIAATEVVVANPTVLVANAEMMVVEVSLVENALQLKHVPMVSVLELLAVIVLEELAVMTEMEEAVDHALLDKDAELVNVNATMIVTKGTAIMLHSQKEQIMDCAPQDHAEPVLLVSLVDPTVDAQPSNNVRYLSQ
jgi:hypothetical protein